MGNPPQPAPEAVVTVAEGYAAGKLIVYPRPEEIGVPVRKDEFDILCEGGISESAASRDKYVAVCIAGIAGLAGILAVTDLIAALTSNNKRSFSFWLLVLFVMAVGGLYWGVYPRAATEAYCRELTLLSAESSFAEALSRTDKNPSINGNDKNGDQLAGRYHVGCNHRRHRHHTIRVSRLPDQDIHLSLLDCRS
jgi:hypothetical protein